MCTNSNTCPQKTTGVLSVIRSRLEEMIKQMNVGGKGYVLSEEKMRNQEGGTEKVALPRADYVFLLVFVLCNW